MLAGSGVFEMVPTFTLEPLDGVGAQLCLSVITCSGPTVIT